MLRTVDFHGLKAVEFSKGDYTALLVPGMGANLVRLANTRLGAEILRTPGADEIEVFKGRPQVFGLPILFPPNRIADGRYTFEGRTYQYPITHRERAQLPPRGAQKRGFHRLEGQRNGRGGDGRVPLLRQCG